MFQFLLAVSEVNTKFAFEKIYGYKKTSQQVFQKKFAKELINNPYLEVEQPGLAQKSLCLVEKFGHKLVTLPNFKTWKMDDSKKSEQSTISSDAHARLERSVYTALVPLDWCCVSFAL